METDRRSLLQLLGFGAAAATGVTVATVVTSTPVDNIIGFTYDPNNPLHIPASVLHKLDDLDFNWKRISIYDESDTDNLVKVYEDGWRAVTPTEAKVFFGDNYHHAGGSWVDVGGLILMKRARIHNPDVTKIVNQDNFFYKFGENPKPPVTGKVTFRDNGRFINMDY